MGCGMIRTNIILIRDSDPQDNHRPDGTTGGWNEFIKCGRRELARLHMTHPSRISHQNCGKISLASANATGGDGFHIQEVAP